MRVINFGSLNLDFVYAVNHFVRPGETLSSNGMQTFLGGKGLNQSIALKRAGADVIHAGCIGNDGEILRKGLEAAGVETKALLTISGERSGHAIIQVDEKGQNCILLYGGANRRITVDQIRETLAECEEGDWLLLQNETNGVAEIMEEGSKKGMHIAFNPSPITEGMDQLPLDKVEYFLLNEVEGSALGESGNAEEILASMRKRYPQAKIVLTLGSDGALCWDGEKEWKQKIFPVKAVDTTAAGDTFTGYFLTAVGNGKNAGEALRIASAASAIAVTREGASPSIPTAAEVADFLKKAGSNRPQK
ncbi:MAG: ribokinase [Candidatus Merdivicinus sp.]|jgi:ribokinase